MTIREVGRGRLECGWVFRDGFGVGYGNVGQGGVRRTGKAIYSLLFPVLSWVHVNFSHIK